MASQIKSVTIENLEAAFLSESMAHIKYRYFAKLARACPCCRGRRSVRSDRRPGSHARLRPPRPALPQRPDDANALAIVIEGETYEYTEMYPKFRHLAIEEGNSAAVAEYDEQIEESRVHAAQFKRTLDIAAKRFAALANVEQRHANHYQAALDKLNAAA
ncbi:rubrerythrin [Massilia sp. B-10]|nr:rubrerythrin [Massilia sp. B-10]